MTLSQFIHFACHRKEQYRDLRFTKSLTAFRRFFCVGFFAELIAPHYGFQVKSDSPDVFMFYITMVSLCYVTYELYSM